MTEKDDGLNKCVELAPKEEVVLVDELADLFESWDLTLQEKLYSLPLFMRRQELSRLIANYELFKLIMNIKGSIFYFGVYNGVEMMTFANLSSALEPYNYNRKVIGFDTFKGFVSIGEYDEAPNYPSQHRHKGGYSSDSKDNLEKLFSIFNRNRPLGFINKTELIEGDVRVTLPEYLENNRHTLASMVYLTMNLYEPTKIALELMWDKIPKGGVVAVQVVNEGLYPGTTKALFDVLGSDVMIESYPFTPNLAYIVK